MKLVFYKLYSNLSKLVIEDQTKTMEVQAGNCHTQVHVYHNVNHFHQTVGNDMAILQVISTTEQVLSLD